MKAISKLFALAVASVALASCSDDLGISKATFSADKAGTTAVLEQPGSGDAFTRMGMVDQVGVVWTADDILRVFTLDNLVYNRYELIEGAGEKSGYFESSDTHELSGTKYAITEADMVYGLSAFEETKARLTMTLTPGYKVDEEMLAGGVHNFPIPMWGKTNETPAGDGIWKIDAKLNSLISYLRVDLKNMPAATKAIVLTTHGHGDESLGGMIPNRNPQGFFQLFSPEQIKSYVMYGMDPSDYNAWYRLYQWEASAGDGSWGGVYGGKSEPLSGTLNCLLEENEELYPLQNNPSKGYLPYLKLDEKDRLVASDTLRVDIAEIKAMLDEYGDLEYENADQVIYLPVLVNTYDKLHVIAVTGDSPLSYQWVGEEIAVYDDETFARNQVHWISLQNIMMKGVVTPQELSYAIQENIELINKKNQHYRTSVIYVENLDNDVDNDGISEPIIIDRETVGNNAQVVIGTLLDPTLPVEIIEGKLKGSSTDPVDDYYQLPIEQKVGAAARNFGIVLPAETPGAPAITWDIILPTSNVSISSADGLNKTSIINVLAADTKEVSGKDLTENDGTALNNYKNASVIVGCGLGRLNILEGSKGDVYCYWGGDEEPFTDYLGLLSINPVSIRLTDYSVKYLGIVDILDASSTTVERNIFTTGTTAIQNFHKIDYPISYLWAGKDLTLANCNIETSVPNHAGIFSYWTGSALTDAAIAAGYDCGKVYTAAQLASVGERKVASGSLPASPSEYIIPHQAVFEIWLGGHDYPWLGAQVIQENFKLDGDGVSLQNMQLEINDYLFNDPHHCCTSCGPVRKMNVKKNLGLIRSIINTTKAEVDNVDLNDVYLYTRARIDNIGSLVGYVETPAATFLNNEIGEIKIDVNGYGIGGMVGTSLVTTLTAKDNATRGTNKDAGYVRSQLDNVGGQFGYIEADGKVLIETSEVNYAKDIISERPMEEATIDSDPINYTNVGGIAGYIWEKGDGDVVIKKSTVTVGDKITGVCMNVGGIAGNILVDKDPLDPAVESAGKVNIEDNTVTVTNNIESLESGNAGGGAGVIRTEKGAITVKGNDVTASEINANGDSFAAGLVAQMYSRKGTGFYEGNDVTADQIYTVNQFAGGWIGRSALYGDDSAKPDFLFCGKGSVTVTTIEATEGRAGGLIGEILEGKTEVGTLNPGGKDVLDIKVTNLKAAYAGGGVIGDNQVDAKVLTIGKATDAKYFNTKVAVTKFVNTKASIWEEYYPYNADKHLLGTFANLLGYMNSNFNVKTAFLTVTNKLTAKMKEDLIYKNHKNRQHTTEGYAYYWGDTKYFVGWGNSGAYLVDGKGQTKGDQNDGNGYNLYKTEADYTD